MFNVAILDFYQVTFSSLDVHLHTEALLNSMNFLNNLLPPSAKKREEGGQEELPTIPEEDDAEKEGEKAMEAVITKKKSEFLLTVQSSYSLCKMNLLLSLANFFSSIKAFKVC